MAVGTDSNIEQDCWVTAVSLTACYLKATVIHIIVEKQVVLCCVGVSCIYHSAAPGGAILNNTSFNVNVPVDSDVSETQTVFL